MDILPFFLIMCPFLMSIDSADADAERKYSAQNPDITQPAVQTSIGTAYVQTPSKAQGIEYADRLTIQHIQYKV